MDEFIKINGEVSMKVSQLKRKETASMAREGEEEWSEVGSDLLECVMTYEKIVFR